MEMLNIRGFAEIRFHFTNIHHQFIINFKTCFRNFKICQVEIIICDIFNISREARKKLRLMYVFFIAIPSFDSNDFVKNNSKELKHLLVDSR